MAAKAVNAGKRFHQNRRFRGHGPLLQESVASIPEGGCTGSIAFAGMARSYEDASTAYTPNCNSARRA